MIQSHLIVVRTKAESQFIAESYMDRKHLNQDSFSINLNFGFVLFNYWIVPSTMSIEFMFG